MLTLRVFGIFSTNQLDSCGICMSKTIWGIRKGQVVFWCSANIIRGCVSSSVGKILVFVVSQVVPRRKAVFTIASKSCSRG